MSALRMLLPGTAVVGDLDDERGEVIEALADLYAYPDPLPGVGWVRAGMLSSLDGTPPGPQGPSGTIGGAAERAVCSVLRGLADVIVVGAGTVRSATYPLPGAGPRFADRRAGAGQPPAATLAVVTRGARMPVPPQVLAGDPPVLLITCASADVDGLRAVAGADRVVVAGEQDVDPVIAIAQLAARGLRRVLLEGGPSLLGRFESAGRLDELCLTLSPLLIAGSGPRIAHGDQTLLRLRPAHLVECDGVLMGRWLVQRP
jgi:riboflavin biosynthesis pyrimidine reductase